MPHAQSHAVPMHSPTQSHAQSHTVPCRCSSRHTLGGLMSCGVLRVSSVGWLGKAASTLAFTLEGPWVEGAPTLSVGGGRG